MAQYRFIYPGFNGTGTVTVNGLPPEPFYEEGTSLEVETVPDAGFTFVSFVINNGFLTSISNPYTFNMPSRDVKLKVNYSGTYTPSPSGYALKYFNDCTDIIGQAVRVEILQYNYVGASEERIIRLNYRLGDFGADEIKPINRSFVNIDIYGEKDEFIEMLDGGYRAWMVRLYIAGDLFWEGYINNNVLSLDEIQIAQIQRFTASDGLNAFDSQRVIEQYFEGFVAGSMLGGLIGALNQTFRELRPINTACEIYETRLDRNTGLFEQLLIPPNAIYTDGELPLYIGDASVVLNTSVFISEFIEALLKPFLCRVFLWKNEFYVISTPEFAKNDYRLFKYDSDGNYLSTETINSGLDLSCKFSTGTRTARSVFTEFTATLELGVLDYSSRGGIYEEKFDIDSWFVNSITSPYAGIYQLRKWRYVNCVPSNQVVNFPSVTDPSGIQYVSSGGTEYLKFWGTSDSQALSDPNLSFIELDTARTGNDIPILQETANQINFSLEFMLIGRSSSEPLRTGVNCGIQIQIGDSYLDWDGNQTFTWTLTPTVMLFPCLNLYAWNTIDIINVDVPEDGSLLIRIYETVVTNVNAEARYSLGFRNLKLKIEQNDAFSNADISSKFVTDETYSNVYDEVKLKIGDVDTANSSSAIRLDLAGYGYPNSEDWSRDGVEALPLIQILLQELGNIKGKPNPRIVATVPYNKVNPITINPYENIVYDGYLWLVNAMEFNPMMAEWRIEIVQLGPIPAS